MSSKQQKSKRYTSTSVDTTSDDATNKNKKARIAIKDKKNEINTNGDKISECNKRNKNRNNYNSNSSKIWLNNKLVDRPKYPTSYGILLHRKKKIEEEEEEVIVENNNNNSNNNNDNNSNNSATCSSSTQRSRGEQFEYLLGLIPQGNSWTVFKGLPEGNNEQPEETAIREFEEESSLTFPYNNNNSNYNWDKKYEILYGVTSTKKLLQIYLIPAPLDIDISKFDISNVAIEGRTNPTATPYGKNKVAKIYKSQISILERAETILNNMK